jgi:hypothetical protein
MKNEKQSQVAVIKNKDYVKSSINFALSLNQGILSLNFPKPCE